MMKAKTHYITILVLLAGLGLLASQLYWLWYTYDINRERFEKDISESLSEAVEMTMVLQTRELVVKRFRASGDSEAPSKEESTSIFVLPGDSTAEQKQITIAAYFSEEKTFGTEAVDTLPERYLGQSKLPEHLDTFIQRAETDPFMQKVFSTLIEQNLKLSTLDSLYRQKLANRHIAMDFQLSLFFQDSLLEQLREEVVAEGKGQAVAKASTLMPPGYYVQAVFPQLNRYLFRKMAWILSGSVLLLLITLGSFAYLLRIIFRQKRLSAIKNDFINNMTHELKTPISVLSAANEALTNFDVLEDRSRTLRYLDVFKQEIQRLNAMVEKVLHISIYERSGFELQRALLDVHEALRVLIERHQLKYPGAAMQLKAELSNPVLMADPEHFPNVLNNLLDNAIKYSRPPRAIRVRTYDVEGQAAIAITDNGIGIAPAHQQAVFDKFYRVPTGDLHDVKGFGLGLSYVKHITELHGGSVSLNSRPGKGSTFTLKIPYE